MDKITPFFWFDSQAEAAVNFYVSLYRDSEIESMSRYPEGAPGELGSVMTVSFRLFGQSFMALNGGPMMEFSSAISFLVSCEDQAEVDRYWSALLDGGEPMQCGWVKDKFGVTWQIVPKVLGELMTTGDAARKQRVMTAMMGMVKLDGDELLRAADSE